MKYRIARFNQKIAEKTTNSVGTMACAYLFAGIAIYGFPYSNVHPATVSQWFSQEFLQLVLLSVIMVGQNVHSDQITSLHKSVKDLKNEHSSTE